MKTRLLVNLISTATLALPVPAFGAAEEASDDWAAYQAKVRMNRPADFDSMDPREQFKLFDAHGRAVAEASVTYYEDHPDDPRRWEAARYFISSRPIFAVEFKPEFAEKQSLANVVIDEAAKAEWEEQKKAFKAAMAAATDVPGSVRQWFEAEAIREKLNDAAQAVRRGENIDFLALGARVKAHAEKFSEREVVLLVRLYGRLVESFDPDNQEKAWSMFLDSSNQAVADGAADRLRFFELTKEPLDIRFTAVDGREVDLADLRGKVVLVDFWAIWCGPCIDELPNVKQVYADYHDKGFEIVGISLDNAGDREKLVAFTKDNEMPWPQYFDGKGWKNDIARRYAVKAIPAMFLLDQEGMVVSTNARGPRLEREVKRLLGL